MGGGKKGKNMKPKYDRDSKRSQNYVTIADIQRVSNYARAKKAEENARPHIEEEVEEQVAPTNNQPKLDNYRRKYRKAGKGKRAQNRIQTQDNSQKKIIQIQSQTKNQTPLHNLDVNQL